MTRLKNWLRNRSPLTILLVSVFIVAVAFNTLVAQQARQQAQRYARTVAADVAHSVATSRYDDAIATCQRGNQRHLNAEAVYLAIKQRSPQFAPLVQVLINTLEPLHDGKLGRLTCAQYARETLAGVSPTITEQPAPPGLPATP